MQYDQKQFTQNGLNMFSNALSNKQSITVDKVIVDDLPTNNFSNLALLSLDSFADAMSFQANYTETSDNTLTVDAVMSNKGFTSSYTINELGLVGHIGDDVNNQSLIAVLVASDPFTLPAQQNNETPSQFIPNITMQLANDDMGQVPVMVSNDAYIAQKDLDKLVSDDGYIKLTDADNRYVKQSDFQNEVNNSVDEKADKSYVDQNISQTNNEVSNKANKTDLSNLQSNINNDVQPQLNQKANQSDLNTTNSNVSSNSSSINSLDSNKADKGDVNGQINQTLSQATAHSDQNLSNAKSYSDNHYNDLSDKNDILSQKMEDYQKPNLIDLGMNNWLNTGHDGNVTMFQVSNVHFEAGKSYWFSLQYQDGSWKDSNPSIMLYKNGWDSFNGDYWGLSYDTTRGKTSLSPKFQYIPQQDETVNIRMTRWSNIYEDIYVRGFTITQSDSYVPFDVAEQNKASIESEGMLTTDYQAPNLAPVTEYEYSDWNAGGFSGGGPSKAPFSINVEKGKNYYFSFNVESSNSNVLGIIDSSTISIGNGYSANGENYIAKWTSDRNGMLNVTFSTSEKSNPTIISKICVTQSDEYVPYEVAQRNKLWNDRISNKTDNLSDRQNDLLKPNLVDDAPSEYVDNQTSWNVHLEAGKSYKMSVIASINKDSQFNLWLGDGSGYWGTIYKAGNDIPMSLSYKSDKDQNVKIWFGPTNGWNDFTSKAKKPVVTQTSDFIPYDIAQSNKEKYINNGQFSEDYQAPNLVDGSSESVGLFGSLRSDEWSGDIAPVNLEAGKKYWISAIVQASNEGISFGISDYPHPNNWMDKETKAGHVWLGKSDDGYNPITNETSMMKINFIAPTTQTYYINWANMKRNSNDSYYSKLTVTQTDNPIPFEVAQRNRLWNDRITNKTDVLSNTMNQQFSQATAHSDQQIASLNSKKINQSDAEAQINDSSNNADSSKNLSKVNAYSSVNNQDDRYNQLFHLNTPVGYSNDVQSIVPEYDSDGAIAYWNVYFLVTPDPQAQSGQTDWYRVKTNDFKSFYLSDNNPLSNKNIAISNPIVHGGNQPWDSVATGSVIYNNGLLSGIAYNAKLAYFTTYKDSKQQTYLAYSNNNEQFKPYQSSPIINPDSTPADFRDPCVVRTSTGLAMYLAGGSANKVYVYTSSDGINWNHNSSDDIETNSYTECPVVKKISGTPILFFGAGTHDSEASSGTEAINGYYDANGLFKTNSNSKSTRLDKGFDFYASNFANLDDDTLVSIGWIDNWKYTPIGTNITQHFGSYSIPRKIRYSGNGNYDIEPIEPAFSLDSTQQIDQGDSLYIGNHKKLETNYNQVTNLNYLFQASDGSNVFISYNDYSLNVSRYNSEAKMNMNKTLNVGSITKFIFYFDTTSVEIDLPEIHQMFTITNYNRTDGQLLNYSLNKVDSSFTAKLYDSSDTDSLSSSKADKGYVDSQIRDLASKLMA